MMSVPPLRAWQRARELVLQHGWNTTAYQILNPGFELWFAAGGDAVVGLVRRSRAWVVGGAPVCASTRLEEVVGELEDAARGSGARVCYVGAQDRLAARCLGDPRYAATVLGAEPWWDPSRWQEILSARASLRAQLHRARNKGVAIRRLEHPEADRPELERLLREWLATRRLPALGFLTSPWLLDHLEDRVVLVAERDGVPVAFLVLSPIPGRHGWLAELVVRGRQAPNGCSELLISEAMCRVAAMDGRFLTLGLSPLARPAVPLRQGPWWLEATMGWMRAHGRRFYDFAGLHAFKSKLAPTGWLPVYAIANEPHLSVRTMWGVGQAVVGGGLLDFGARAIRRAVAQEFHWALGR